MTNLEIFLLALATLLLSRVVSAAVVMVTDYAALVGGRLHGRMRIKDGSTPDAWLFSLLLGITKYPLIALICTWFFGFVLIRILDVAWVEVSLYLVQGLILFLLGIRLIAAFFAAITFGSEVHTVLKSLQS